MISCMPDLKYDNQQHFKVFFAVYGMGMFGRHNDGLPFLQFIYFIVNGNCAHAVQTDHKGIAVRLVGADLFPLGKRNKVTLTALFCTSVLLTT